MMAADELWRRDDASNEKDQDEPNIACLSSLALYTLPGPLRSTEAAT